MASRSLKSLIDFQCCVWNKRPVSSITSPRSRFFHQSSCISTQENETTTATETISKDAEFRVYEIEGLKPREERARRVFKRKKMNRARFHSMPVDQDWTDVWPTAATFNWSSVPFPVRQGFIASSIENEGVVPSSYGNLELMKPPNFLHLTPAHVKKHCAVLKKFCNEWPEGLNTDEDCRKHFPIESVTSDYVFSGPSIADDRARLARIQFHLSDLGLNYKAKDKFIRLVEERYDPSSDLVTFESDRCPLRSQNMEYLKFLLTAVYFESWKFEGWEKLKTLMDMEKYFWDMNKSKETTMSLLKRIKEIDMNNSEGDKQLGYLPSQAVDEEVLSSLPEVKTYKAAVEELYNEGENTETLDKYKNSVKKLLNIV